VSPQSTSRVFFVSRRTCSMSVAAAASPRAAFCFVKSMRSAIYLYDELSRVPTKKRR